MNELSEENQKWIIKLVKKQKKVELRFISTVLEVSEKNLITNAEKMGLMVEDEFLVLPTHLVPTTSESEVELEPLRIRELMSDYVFCPKCGMENFFKLSNEGKKLIYFCIKCQSILNNFWDGYNKGRYGVAECSTCQQPTFRDFQYCISCGSINKRETVMYSEQPAYQQPLSVASGKKLGKKQAIYFIFILSSCGTGIYVLLLSVMFIVNLRMLSFGISLIVIPYIVILIQIVIHYRKKKKGAIK